MNAGPPAPRVPSRRRHADRGFTLVELLIAVVLSGVIAGVIVAALVTALNVASTTTDAVRNSTDAGLSSAYLYRDAASAGAIDPATAQRDDTLGVSTSDWDGCTQPGALVVRFSWADHHTSALTQSRFVATYALDGGLHELTRRLCTDGTTTVDVVVGSSIGSAVAACNPGPTCAGMPESVSLELTGSGVGAPVTEMTASLRGDTQAAPQSTNSSPVALLALGRTPTAATCPNLTLDDTETITVIGDAFIDGSCVGPPSPIDDVDSMLQPTGETSSIAGIVDPFEGRVARPDACLAGGTTDPIGESAGPNEIVVYSGLVSIATPLLFEPGRYVFCDGLEIVAGAQVTGSDILFYVHGGTLSVDADATVQLKASTTGPYANLLIWVESAPIITINGGPRVNNLRGLIYAPTSTLQLTSAVAANVGGVIVKDLVVEGAGQGRARIGLPMPVLAISPTSLPTMQVDVAYTAALALSVSGGPSASTFWTASALPPGLSIDPTTGQITGTPTASGPFGFIVTAFDDSAAAVSIDYLVSIAPELTITTANPLPDGQVGSLYDITMTPSGGTPIVPPPSYTWSATDLPAGLTIDPATGRISGTPTTAGLSSPTITVTDAMTSRDLPYTISINPPPTVTTPSPLPPGQAGTAYSKFMAASGGTPPYTTWTATGLPAGLTIDVNSGEIRGTPITEATYTDVYVTVTDAIGAASVPAQFTLTIGPPAVVLTISGPATLPTGERNATYPIPPTTAAMTAVGGVSPYTWSATGLPAGLTIEVNTGVISGTPTVEGTFPVTVTVTDLAMATAQRAYTLTVVAPGCPTTPIVGWRGQYYSNRTLSGTSTLCRDDASINFNWTDGIPAPGLPVDDFSVRWTRTQDFAAGDYTFTMGSDDGSRLLIDGVLVFSNWVDQPYPTDIPTFAVPLIAGSHTIVMEFYERGGDARATLAWYSCSGPTAGWHGEYFSNTTLTGPPTRCRDDAAVNFDWLTGVPITGVPADNFSVRWTRTENFTGGNYRFTMGSDAGARLRIDGVLVIDDWSPAQTYPATPPSTIRNLVAGDHTIVMEYYETTGTARATLNQYSCAGDAVGWGGEYYSNTTLAGTPTLCRDDATVSLNTSGAPAPGLPTNNFSIRWTRTQNFAAGDYTFTMGSDAGARLMVDGVLVLDNWTAHGYPAAAALPTIAVTLSAGSHTIVMEYYDTGGSARATLTWYSCAGPALGWHGDYYGNTTLTGSPARCRDDPAVNFNWGTTTVPIMGVAVDNYSVRWTRTQNFSAGNYRFTMGSDAGARLLIDGVLVLDHWTPAHLYGTPNVVRTLAGGNHTIVMEYYETTGTARATLTWVAL